MTISRRWWWLLAPLLGYAGLLLALNAGGGRWAVIWRLNHTPPVVPGSARCAHVIITPDLRVRLEGVSAELQSGRQRYTLAIPLLRCERSLISVWRRKHLTLTIADGSFAFSHLRPGQGTWDAGVGGPNDIDKVTVTYNWTLLTPLIRPFFANGQIRLVVESAMKNEARFN